MSTLEMEVGELKGTVKALNAEVPLLRKAIEDLNSFKWRLIGAASLASFVSTGLAMTVFQLWRITHGS